MASLLPDRRLEHEPDQIPELIVLQDLVEAFGHDRLVADAAFLDVPLGDHVLPRAGGQELDALGFGADVDVAAEVGASSVVPVLRDGVFVDAAALG